MPFHNVSKHPPRPLAISAQLRTAVQELRGLVAGCPQGSSQSVQLADPASTLVVHLLQGELPVVVVITGNVHDHVHQGILVLERRKPQALDAFHNLLFIQAATVVLVQCPEIGARYLVVTVSVQPVPDLHPSLLREDGHEQGVDGDGRVLVRPPGLVGFEVRLYARYQLDAKASSCANPIQVPWRVDNGLSIHVCQVAIRIHLDSIVVLHPASSWGIPCLTWTSPEEIARHQGNDYLNALIYL
mmetsp:Transcript_91894/g.244136  ORF Transcript_91894/g.244136 Transcript_91894/m.244136 type:complete len:243 (-) Transcript_91894:283-1011(-)